MSQLEGDNKGIGLCFASETKKVKVEDFIGQAEVM